LWFAESETHFEANGNQKRRWIHLSAGGPTLARVESGNKVELQYADALQNLIVSLNEQGGIVANFIYSPFGEVLSSRGADDHRRQFNGKENDKATGLRYYGFRYYDPLILRWNSSDPLYRFRPEVGLVEPQRMNLYGFTLNNPLRYVDPDGRDVVLVGKDQPPTLNLNKQQRLKAAKRPASFSPMSRSRKDAREVSGAAAIKSALSGRSDKKVAYWGHAFVNNSALSPDKNSVVTASDFAGAVRGMASQPTDIYVYGCKTVGTGFAKELSSLLPNTTIHAFDKDVDVTVRGPQKRNGDLDKEKAVLVPPSQPDQFKAGKRVPTPPSSDSDTSTPPPT
jgi:RHS repeat-associated protein